MKASSLIVLNSVQMMNISLIVIKTIYLPIFLKVKLFPN